MTHARSIPSPTPPFEPYRTVKALVPLPSDEGLVPVGADGTIVDVCATPGYVIVEFVSPFHTIVTAQIHQLQ